MLFSSTTLPPLTQYFVGMNKGEALHSSACLILTEHLAFFETNYRNSVSGGGARAEKEGIVRESGWDLNTKDHH